jgi:hypothetical protein
VTCDDCGLVYSQQRSPSRRQHTLTHYEWIHGVRLRQPSDFEDIGEIHGLRALLVRPSSSLFLRRRAERVARRAIRGPVSEERYDRPQYFAQGSNSPDELYAHAVLLARDMHGVGIVVLERRPIIEFYRWTTRPKYELAYELTDTSRWSIVYAWLLPDLRGCAIATGLVRLAINGFNETPDTIGWLSPYTTRGFGLIARLTLSGFHRAQDELPQPYAVNHPFAK